jgi:large subunit ribosomal protein L18
MYGYLDHRNKTRIKRALRVRKKLRGTSEMPRLSIHKTNRNIFAQIIDDESGKTLLSASTIKDSDYNCTSKQYGKKIGEALAKEAIQKKISRVVVDRGRFKYHGVLAELVTSFREAGIQV